VDVKQKRISEGDADDRYRVGEAQQGGPGVGTEIEKPVESDDEVARMPPTHRERKRREHALDVRELGATADELHRHPKR